MILSTTGRQRGTRLRQPGESSNDLALAASLKQSALRQSTEHSHTSAQFKLALEDLHIKLRYRPCRTLLVLLVDASDSMGDGALVRIKAAKGAALALLRRAYQKRSRVAVIAFGGEQARVVLPPTQSIHHARHLLERLPVGGATPFADGLVKAQQLIRLERMKDPSLRPLLLIVSDGEANVPLNTGTPPWPELMALATTLRKEKLSTSIIDASTGSKPSADLKRLAQAMGAACLHITDLKPRDLIQVLDMDLKV
jgi:magnesium chelatase subunit D